MAASGGGPEAPHRPVLLVEAVRLLAPERGGLFVDATLGLGGHSEAILEASADARVLGIDRDREALRLASERLTRFGSRFRAAHANFRDIARVMREAGEPEASGVLADLGVSSLQFDTPERGFSFQHPGPLDMRMAKRIRRRNSSNACPKRRSRESSTSTARSAGRGASRVG